LTAKDRGSAEHQAESASRGAVPSQTGVFARSGEYWTLGYGGSSFPLKDVKGLSYVQRLLQHPGDEFHALDLLSGPGAGTTSERTSVETRESSLPVGITIRPGLTGDAGELLDAQAKQDYKRKLLELREELEDQRERGNHARAEEVETEIEFLARELTRAVGLGGRDRRAGSAAERARLNATRAIKGALQKVSERDASLGQLLERTIRTGSFCSYVPDRHAPVSWQFSVEGHRQASGEAEAAAPVLFRRETNFLHALANQETFVGREAERALLRRLLEQALAREGKVVMIGGAPGAGKTRIAGEFAAEAHRRGFLTLVGSCYDRDDSIPFNPVVEILEAALANSSSPAAFRRVLGHDAAEMARLMPQLRRMFPDIPPPMEGSAEQSRRILFNAVVELITRVATNTPLLLLLEDLHWADEGSLSLVNHVARSVSNLPIMIVGTYRDNELEPAGSLAKALDELIRVHLLERIMLQGLPQNAVAEMLRALSGREPPEAVVNLFHSHTEGNPFFVEELFLHLVEQGKLTDSAGEFRRDLKLGDLDVPQSLRLVIGRQLARLSDPTQKTLATAAVIGRSFTFGLLEASTRADADVLLDRVEEAERAGLISSTVQYPEARFNFSHELFRQTVVSGLSAPRRQRLHLDVADAIERLYADALEDHADDLAHHLWQAGAAADPGRTIRYLQLAGDEAVQRSANLQAIGYYTRALEMVQTLPDTPERAQQELMLHIVVGTPLIATKGFASPEVEKVYTRARTLCQQAGDSPQLFPVLWGLWVFYTARAQHKTARELAEQCLRLAQSAQDPELLLEAHHALGITLTALPQSESGLEHLEQSIAHYDPERHASMPFRYGQDAKVVCLAQAAWTIWIRGYPERALKKYDEALRWATEISHPYSLVAAFDFGAMVHQLRRDAQATVERAESAIRLSTEQQFAYWTAWGCILRGWALTQREQVAEGIAQMKEALSAFRATGAEVMVPYFLGLLADAYCSAGQIEEGLKVLLEAQAAVSASEERFWEAELCRLKGELTLKRNRVPQDRAEAETCFLRALAIARDQSAKSLELRAAMSLHRLWQTEGRRADSRQVLAEVYGRFTEGFDTADLREAKMLIEESG
jgi:predicted ATPase